ncbi:MFS transporter [Thermoplasmatales archaeon AK]|nr:MFS transporter [Thermoplasmatales archaeon AK]
MAILALRMKGTYLTRNVILISLSAFFADLGYQAVLAGFPYFLVFVLQAPVYLYGIAEAVNYGIGSIFSYAGGRIGDRIGNKRTAIIGNAFVPILSLTGLASGIPQAIAIRAAGWYMRNFRSPSRRAMLVESVDERDRGRAFGFLHGLDVGGGLLSSVFLVLLLFYGISIKDIFLLTAIPIVASTLVLVPVKPTIRRHVMEQTETPAGSRLAYLGVLLSTSLFGFSFYSMGYPIITITESFRNPILGILSYTIFMGASATAGAIFSRFRVVREIRMLGYAGYLLAAFGSLGFALSLHFGASLMWLYISDIVISFGTGSVETFEPSILSATRSIGLFTGNIVMGILYIFSAQYSYLYAFAVSGLAALIIITMGSRFERSVISE